MTDRLHQYEARRDFHRTPEPRPMAARPAPASDPLFVVQEHRTREPHFDLRLEIDGVLISWVLPAEPGQGPVDRRLEALRMEDHPLAYAHFEGEIPTGEYGAGQVRIWDQGTFRNVTTRLGQSVNLDRALDEGQLVIQFAGEKLRGDFVLHRSADRTDEERWHLDPVRDPSKPGAGHTGAEI